MAPQVMERRTTKARELGVTDFPYIERDEHGRVTYHESISGLWEMREYDQNGKQTFYANSIGHIFGTRKTNKQKI